jgi:hypothetical protein
MIDVSIHTRKIWRSHFDGADGTTVAANFAFKNYGADKGIQT